MAVEENSGLMVKYQFEIDDSDWEEWKKTVPRTKSLDKRIRELIAADTEDRVVEHTEEEAVVTEPTQRESVTQDVQQTVDRSHRDNLRDELAGSGDLLESRVSAILSMYEVLRERGKAEKDDLLDAVDIDATGYKSRESVWSNMVKGKDTLRALPGVQTPPTGKTEWRYSEDHD